MGDAQASRPRDGARQERDHDLLSALVAIEGGLRALRDAGPDGKPDLLDALIREASFARSLLAPDVVTAGGTTAIGELLASLGAGERARGGRIEVEVEADLRADVPEGRLHQVLRNLLDNARRHAPGAAVQLRAFGDGPHATILVQDDGPGIPADRLAGITGRGVTGASATSGTGLGLHVAVSLIQASGGTLSVTSGPAGTTVTVRVPRVRVGDLEAVR